MNQIYFNDIGTYDDWGLRLVNLNISAANPKFHYIDIPAGDGAIDLTEALTGEPKYEDRTLEAILRVNIDEYVEKLEIINSNLQGKKIAIKTFEKPGYYLIGRCTVEFQRLNHIRGNIIINARCEPWYFKDNITTKNVTLPTNGTSNITLKNSRKRVIPTITTNAQVTIKMGNVTRVIVAGTHRLTNIILIEGDNLLTITGTQGTTVKFEYQEGAL